MSLPLWNHDGRLVEGVVVALQGDLQASDTGIVFGKSGKIEFVLLACLKQFSL